MSLGGFRKPAERNQGLKLLFYGENNSGKSVATLTFPDNAIVDSESKIGVYENDPEYKPNIAGIADTANYYETIDLAELVVNNPKQFKTFTIDSLTNIQEVMQVSAMENEEERAKKKRGNVDDATVSMRGWGKIKLNTIRFNNYIAQASANGTTVIAVAHKEDIMQEIGGQRVKVGERASLRKNSEHTFDVIIKFFKEKDLSTGEFKFIAEVEKDTTKTYKVGTKLEGFTYDNLKEYIERQSGSEVIETQYGSSIESNVESMQKEQEDHDEVAERFKALFKQAVDKDAANKEVVSEIMKKHNCVKYNDPSLTKELKLVINEIEKLLK